MRTYILYGALALSGCAAPENAFPQLSALPTPEPPKTSDADRQAAMRAIEADGDATRAKGEEARTGAN